MPTRDNTQPVHLTVELTKIFREKWKAAKKENPKIQMGTVVNEFLRRALYYEEQMELAKEHIEYVRPVDDKLLFYDKDSNRSIMIHIRDKCLFCEEDKTDNCRHVGFAWTIPEVVQKLKEHGFKPPRG